MKDQYWLDKELVCGVINKCISNGVKEHLEQDPDYAIKKRTDPIWLWKRMQHYCMSYKGNKYLPAVYINTLHGIANIQQYEQETVTNFVDCLKNQ